MKKLLASDIDGTLYVNNQVHEKSIDYIKKFRNNGHALLLCTGRNLSGVKYLIDNFDIEPDGFILCNGAVILDKDLNVIKEETLEDDTLKRTFEEFKDNDKYNFYFSNSEYIYFIEGYNNNPRMNTEKMKKEYNIVILSEDEFYNNSYKANSMGVEVKSADIIETQTKIDEITKLMGEKLTLYRNQYFIDIVPKDCSKSTGIKDVLEVHGVLDDDVYVIGDSWNDLSMFEKFKNSYTFTYAEEDLKKHASNVIEAFYDCLEHIID